MQPTSQGLNTKGQKFTNLELGQMVYLCRRDGLGLTPTEETFLRGMAALLLFSDKAKLSDAQVQWIDDIYTKKVRD